MAALEILTVRKREFQFRLEYLQYTLLFGNHRRKAAFLQINLFAYLLVFGDHRRKLFFYMPIDSQLRKEMSRLVQGVTAA